jgi:hypothetical protein
MSEDDINLYIVIISFILLFLYLNYVQNMAMLKQDWENLKCNPLYLFIKSIGAPNDVSSKDFQTCVAKYGQRNISPTPCTPTTTDVPKNIGDIGSSIGNFFD